ncbi:P25-alpha [Aphelenchoides besseyi]|nr:P25-alpha [Aphelenchoides besseyi]KAI6192631.1 P25-alpha [Aphelenchoides besseyi]
MSSNNSSSPLEYKWNEKEMKKRWEQFAKFGGSTANEITGKNFDKWLTDAGVIDKKNITTIMTGISFSKVTGPKKKANFSETKEVLANVAKDRATTSKKDVQDELDDIIEKLSKLEAPVVKVAVKPETQSNVYERLTDTKKYTGSHKERFDESGKGKGKAGRVDIVENTGYVSSYKAQGTYDKIHK